ncbi:hypothetical protein EEB14_25000 [Rhodococcus sp. WS4]|nr:hypothetical protein EEB14_25000 [Rhodococcus sp. WS4]
MSNHIGHRGWARMVLSNEGVILLDLQRSRFHQAANALGAAARPGLSLPLSRPSVDTGAMSGISLRPQPAWEVDAWCCCNCGTTILVDSADADGWTVHAGGTIFGYPVIFPVCPPCDPELRSRYWA